MTLIMVNKNKSSFLTEIKMKKNMETHKEQTVNQFTYKTSVLRPSPGLKNHQVVVFVGHQEALGPYVVGQTAHFTLNATKQEHPITFH